ncbi:MAG: hypothetical protein R3C46_03780 [Hyphomonadaceae bacterium]
MPAIEVDAASQEQSAKLRTILYAQTRLLDGLIHHLTLPETKAGSPEVIRVAPLMLQALGISVHSALKLCVGRDMAIRDAYGIARSATELAVNIAYIAAGGSDVARRADRHAMQKTYRDMTRRGEIGGLQFTITRDQIPRVEEMPGLPEALAEFTGKKGQELTDWTPVSISGRIKEVRGISETAGIYLAGAVSSIYRHSSELLHGTYFGVIHFWRGNSAPATSREAFDERWEEHFLSIFNGLFFSVGGVITLYAQMFAVPEIGAAQQQLVAATEEWVEQRASR